jgi:hypothetical protein
MYIKIKDGQIQQYPYTQTQLKKDNPDTSFPQNMTKEALASWGVYQIKLSQYPEFDYTKNIVEGTPQLIDNEWTQVWEVTSANNDEILERVLELRASEYPPMSDYLDGIVKGDQAQVDKYIADCLAVKAKYPKP